jgi:hypothetical protein
MGRWRRDGLIWVLVCVAISVLWGISIGRGGNAWIDFRAVYAGTRCLIHEQNPYKVSDLALEYKAEDGQRPPDTPYNLQAITLYVNVPTTFVIVAPFALLSWGPAHVLWMLVTGCAFIMAMVLMWRAGAENAPQVSTLLTCMLAVSCASIFAAGNTAGIVVGLCGIAVWCFLENRFVRMGVLCLGLSLAIKPHDVGWVWLYFVLAGGAYRKRALQSLVITAVIGLTAVIWVGRVAPGWIHDWSTNLATISARGGMNEPGPHSFSGHSVYTVVDLQAAVAIFRDDPGFYNAVSYAFCGALLLVWAIWTLRAHVSVSSAWLALAAAAAFTLLITYHRPWDAKLTMLSIPPCCKLWTERGRVGKLAFFITAAVVLFAGDIALSVFKVIANSLHVSGDGFGGKLLSLVLLRPEPIALVAMGIFYLWVYLKAGAVGAQGAESGA